MMVINYYYLNKIMSMKCQFLFLFWRGEGQLIIKQE